MTPSKEESESKAGRWQTMRGWMRETEKHEWTDGKKSDRLKAATSQCYSVSVCLCHYDRSATVGKPEQLGPHCCTQGLHTLTDRAKGCPVYRTSQSAAKPYSPTACLTPAAHPPVLNAYMYTQNILIRYDGLRHFWRIWKCKVRRLYSVLRNQEPRCSNYLADCLAGRQRILCVCNWLIPHFWNMNAPEVCSEISARECNKLSCYSLLSNIIARGGAHTPLLQLSLWAFVRGPVIFKACQWYCYSELSFY